MPTTDPSVDAAVDHAGYDAVVDEAPTRYHHNRGAQVPAQKSGGVPGSDGSQPPAGDPGGGSSPGGGAVGATTARWHASQRDRGRVGSHRAHGGSSSDARAADLSSPTLAGLDATHDADGLGLLWWLLVLVVVAA